MNTADNLIILIKNFLNGKVVFVGIGNTLKKDDGAGVYVIHKLKEKKLKDIILLNVGNVPENYLEKIKRYQADNIIFFDAVDFAAMAGEIKLFKGEEINSAYVSTHDFSLNTIIDYLSHDGLVGMAVVGIQPKEVSFGEYLNAEVEKSVDWLVEKIATLYRQEKSDA